MRSADIPVRSNVRPPTVSGQIRASVYSGVAADRNVRAPAQWYWQDAPGRGISPVEIRPQVVIDFCCGSIADENLQIRKNCSRKQRPSSREVVCVNGIAGFKIYQPSLLSVSSSAPPSSPSARTISLADSSAGKACLRPNPAFSSSFCP